MSLLLLVVAPLVIGVFLAYRGARGVPSLSDPKCARCGYDLRWIDPNVNTVCPECGSDLKARRAIRFADYERRPRLIVVGGCLIVLAIVAPMLLRQMVLLRTRGQGPQGAAALSNTALIARLPSTIAQPWDWQELRQRLSSGELTKSETSAVIEALIMHFKTKPGGWNQPLHWSGEFIAAADRAKAIPPEQFSRLAVACFGAQPDIEMRTRCREGQPLRFEARYGSPWPLAGCKLVWALKRVTVNGQPVAVYSGYSELQSLTPEQLSQSGSSRLHGQIRPAAAAGPHKLAFEFDMGLVPESAPFRTESGVPGQADRWPKPRCTWSKTVEIPVELIGDGSPIVALVTDPKLDPVAGGQLSASATLYAYSNTESTLKLMFQTRGLSLPIVSKLTISAGDVITANRDVSLDPGIQGHSYQFRIPYLPRGIQVIDLVLTPSPASAEQNTVTDRIWGKEIILKAVPLQREDLDEAKPPSAPPP